MDQWWERHSGVDLGEETKETIEDLTGCIPLLLDRSVVGTEHGTKIDLTVHELCDISENATRFTADIKDKARSNSSIWKRYV